MVLMSMVLLGAVNGYCGNDAKYEEEARQWHQQLLDKTKGVLHPLLTPVTIYGQVVDQFGVPIKNVEIRASWATENLVLWKKTIHENILKTDAAGMFSFSSYVEYYPDITIRKPKGYDYLSDSRQPLSIISPKSIEMVRNHSESNPILFHLRKMGITTYLHETPYGFRKEEPVSSFAFDMVNRKSYNMNKDNSRYKHPVNIDLVYDYKRDAATGVHTLRFYVPQKNINLPIVEPAAANGMQVSDTMLYEAPETGYEKEITMSFKSGDEMTKYLYFTSRNPAVYSRMQMYFRASPEDLFLDAEIWTNPYGSRNLVSCHALNVG